MSDEDKRRISESFLWENEPMSAAAILGGHQIDDLGRSFSTRRLSQNASFTSPGRSSHDAASCVWENEPMSAAASAVVPRLTLERVSEVPESMLVVSESNVLDRPVSISASELVDAPRLASVKTRSTRSGVPAWRPHRPAPPPPLPQRSNSFPTHQPNEDYLEYEVTSSLTLKETPRSQRRHDLQRELLQRQQKAGVQLVSAVAHHHHTSDSLHVSFALTGLAAPEAPSASTDAVDALQSDPLATSLSQVDHADVIEDVNSLVTEPLLPPATVQLAEIDHQLDTASSMASIITVDEVADELIHDVADAAEALLLPSRPASMLTMYESAHSGALSDVAGSDSHLDQD